MKKTLLFAAAALAVSFFTFADSGAWKQDLAVAGYTGTETLTDFPVLVRLPANFPYSDCGADGGTLRFIDADENVLSHEIDTWNPSGESLVWVKLPSLAPSGTTFTLFFGDTNPYVGVSVDFRQTWSRYAAVVHGGTTITGNTYDNVVFDGTTPETTGDVHDSSPNDVSVKMFRNGITKTTTDGYLGSCFERSGFTAGSTSLGLGVGNPRLEGRLDDIYKFSISGWYKANATGTYTLAGDGSSWSGNAYFWLTQGGSYLSFAVNGSHNYTSDKWALEANVWRHFEVTVIDKDYVIQYRDGEAAAADPLKLNKSIPGTNTYHDSYMSFGALRAVANSDNNKNCWMGLMDELRVFNGTASADWVKAEFETASKTDFLTAGEIDAIEYGDAPVFSGFRVSGTSYLDVRAAFNLRWAGTDKETANAVVKYGLAEDALTETLDIGAVAVGVHEAELPSMTPDTTYYFQLTVDNDLTDPVVSQVVTFKTPPLDPLTAVGTAVSSGANPYVGLIDRKDGTYALIFTNAQTTTFTFNSSWTVKQFLVVGGGGAGGGNVGGGGGGGGVIWYTNTLIAADNLKTDYSNGDTISVIVGAGGVGGFKQSGTAGGHSTLSLGDNKTYTAFGGGGGGHYDSVNPVPGADGNTGCGAGVYNGNKATNGYKTSMPSLSGYYGTNGGNNNGSNATGGGGGAGEAGSNAPSGSKGGKGGDGLACSITGAEIYYAAGGGGGDNNQNEKDPTKKAQGGLGGGGHASIQIGRANPETSTRPSEGTDATGYGCGGGGGVGGQNGTATGGNGSAGIVVLLIEPLSFTVSPSVSDIGAHTATISATPLNAGETLADVYFAYGESAAALGEYQLVSGAGLAEGAVWSRTLTGLLSEHEYFYSFVATNNSSPKADVKVDGSFTTLPLAPPSITDVTITPGIMQATVSMNLASVGEDADSAVVLVAYGTSADNLAFTNVINDAATTGSINYTIDGLALDATTYYCAFTATNANGKAMTTATYPFTTEQGEKLAISGPTATGGKGVADVSVMVDKLGEGASSVELTLIWGTDKTNLDHTNLVTSAAGLGEVNYRLHELPRTQTPYYYGFVATNGLGQTMLLKSDSMKFTTSNQAADCLWGGAGEPQADGSYRWDDYRNWANGAAPELAGDKVYFPDGTVVTIEMPASAYATSGEFAISNNCHIVLKKSSEVAADLEYKFNGKVTLPETSSLTLSGSHVYFSNGTASNYKFEGNLTVTDGAYFQLQAGLVLSNNLITVEKKSKFGLPNGSPTLAGEAKLILDDSELLSEGGDRTITFKNNAKLVFRGQSPQASIIVNGDNDNRSWDSHLVFCIPAGGYDCIPLKNRGASPVPNKALLYCTVDSESPAYSSPMNKVVPLISTSRSVGYWKGKDTMRLDELGECPTETMREWVYVTNQLTDENLASGAYDSREIWTSATVKDDIPGDNLVKTLGVYVQGPVSYPVFNAPTIEPDIHTAAVEVTFRTLGVDATSADVYIACGKEGEDLGEFKLVKKDAVLSDVIQTSIDGLDYDTNYYYVLLATNDLDPAQSGATTNHFTTLPAEVMAISGPTAVPGKGISDFSVTVDKLGEGASSVGINLIWGTDKANLDKTNLVTTAATLGTVDYRLYELPRSAIQYYYAFVATNGLGQVVSTITNGFKTVAGSVDCLWSGEGEQQADGSYRWDDYRNWASEVVPTNTSDVAYFPDGTEVTIEMPAVAFTTSGEFAISNNCHIVLKKSSEVDDDVLYKFTGKVTLPASSSLTLSGSHVYFFNGNASNYKFEGDLTLTDGAYFQLQAGLVLTDNRIVVEKKSKFGLPSGGPTLAGGTEIVLDDSEFVSEGGSRTVIFKDNATLVFKGKSPYAYIFVKGNGASYTPHLLFNIPQGGYDRIPLVNSYPTGMPSAAVVYCAIDSQSPAYSQSIDKVVPLIVSANSVTYSKSSTNMLLDEIVAPAGAEAAWVYRTDVMSDADVTAGTYDARDAWSDAEPRSEVPANAVKTLGVYIKGGGEPGGPVFNTPVAMADKRTATVSVSLKAFGEDATSAAVYFAYGTSADALGDYALVKDGAALEDVLSVELSGLEPETKYYYSFIASNNLEKAGSVADNFETLSLAPPSITDVTITPAITEATVNMTLASVGDEAESAVVLVAYGTSSDNLATTDVINAAAVTGPIAYTIKNLDSRTTYYCVFTATNANGKSMSTTNCTFKTLRDPGDSDYAWSGAASGDWDNPANWEDGEIPPAGYTFYVEGPATITRNGETARITDARITVNADGSLTLLSGTVLPHPTLDLTQPVAGQPLTVAAGTFGGITSDASFSVEWKRGASIASKSYQPNAYATTASITPTADDYEFFFQCTVKDSGGTQLWQKEFFFSKLPVLYMTTDNGHDPSWKTKETLPGNVFVQGNETWASPYDGAMTIKVRGNTTANDDYSKKPWKLKLDSKTEMFGIAKSKHWVLLANYREKSAMRNKLAYDLANEIGSLGMETTWVECILNGEYQGLYLFGEQIRIAKDRVDIFDWEGAAEDAADAIALAHNLSIDDQLELEEQMSENLAWVTTGHVTFKSTDYDVGVDWPEYADLDKTGSGGYLVESSKEMDEVSTFTITSGTLTFESMLNSPEFLNTNPEMFNICSNRVDDYLAALASPDGYNAKGQHWSQLADTDSMATYLLAIELLGNDDAEKKSRYFYWDVGGLINFGPVWDFDWGVGNTLVDKNIGDPEKWRAHNNNPRSFFREWTDDPWFCTRLRTLYWTKARDVLARIVSEGGEIDRYQAYLTEAAAANDEKWPVASNPRYPGCVDRSFTTDVGNLRTFLTARLNWLDEQFADVPTLMESFKKSCLKANSSRSDLDDLLSNSPYTADTNGLQIVFNNAMSGSIGCGMDLQMSATVASNTVTAVDVYVNGLKVGESLEVESGAVACTIPAAALTETPTNDNCVALVARNESGEVVSRNYRLVHTVSAGAVDGYTFYFHGDYTGDQIIAPTGTECVVIFDGANIDGKLVLPDGVKAYLCPTNGTANTVAGIDGPGAHLTLKDFDGQNGKVSLTGVDTLIAISNLVVKSGTLDLISTGVSSNKVPVVKVLGHVKQDGGVINLDTRTVSSADPATQVYGIFLANKDPKDSSGEKMKIIYAEFNGGTFNATVGGWKSAALYIDKGSVDATFNDGCTNNVSLVGPEARFVNVSGDLNLKGGEFTVRMPETYTSLTNARVFKSDKKIKIKGGHYVVDVPASGSEIFSTSDQGKGDESSITIDGGTFELESDDDCFNADHHITVNDGLFYAVSSNNDVFDSNGDMTINGGTIMAYAQAAGHEAFDVDPVLTEEFGIPHVLTINGGTIFATGGKNSAWPETLTTGTGVTLLKLEDTADVSAYSGKYLTLPGLAVTATAKLPTFPANEGSILATCFGLGTATTNDTKPADGDQNFHDLYIVLNEGMDQTGLRFLEIYGSTTGDGDTGEYFVLTNVTDKAINLAGVKINLHKLDDYENKKASKCCITLTDGELAAGGTIRFDQADFGKAAGWEKITNGKLHIEIFDATGATVQVGETKFELYPETDGMGASLIAKRFDNETPLTMTTDDWKSSVKNPVFGESVVDPGTRTAAVEVAVLAIGDGATGADVYVACGTDVNALEYTLVKTVGEADLPDTVRTTLTDLEPDTQYYCVLYATNNLVPVQSVAVTNEFHTLPIEQLEITGPTATGKPGAVDLGLSVNKFGEGASSVGVSVIWGTAANNLNNTNDYGTVETLGAGNYLLGGLDRSAKTYYYAFVVTNGLGEVLSTTTNSFTTTVGNVNCLWVGKGEQDENDGSYRWDDWRNWECGVVPAANDNVYFPDNTEATIEMPWKANNTGNTFYGNKFVVSNNCDLVFTNPRDDMRCEYCFNNMSTDSENALVLPETSSLTLSGCMMYITCKAQATFNGNYIITDGGYLKFYYGNVFSNCYITVEKGSKFGFENNKPGLFPTVFAGKTKIIVDDSELQGLGTDGNRTAVFKDEATLELRGKIPYAHFEFDGAGDDSTPHIIFNIPAGGYECVPFINDKGDAMPDNKTIYLAIDPGSPAFKSGMDKVVTLVSQNGSKVINYSNTQSNLVLEVIDAPRGVETEWVYRNGVVSSNDVVSGTYDSRVKWSPAVPQSEVAANQVKALGVYINGALVNPVFDEPVVTAGIRDASIDVSLFGLGKDANKAAVYFACGTNQYDLGGYQLVTNDAEVAAVLNVALENLSGETRYYYAFIASNDLNKAGTVTGEFMTRSPRPTLEDPKAEAILQTVRLGVTLASVGEATEGVSAESAEVKVMWGESADALTNVVVLADAAKAGDFCNTTLKGLPDEMTLYYAFTADNGAETVTTVTNSFVTPKWNKVGGPYDYYPTEPGLVPEGYGVTFVANDLTTPYHVIPLSDCHYAVTSTVTKTGQVYWFYSEGDFEANASAMIGEKYYLFLSDAVDAAKGGDTIELIRDNNFVAKQMEIDMPLVIHGNGHTVKVPRPYVDESGYVNKDGCSKDVKTVFCIMNGSDAEISDMTVLGGGDATHAGNSHLESAVVVKSGGVLKMENVTLTRSNGGLVTEKDSYVLLDGCQIVRNGRYCGAGIFNRGNIVMVNTSVSENRTTFPDKGGGAIENQGRIYVSNCVICNNSSGEYGGAINNYSDVLGIEFYMIDTTISGNFTHWNQKGGGGIALRSSAPGLSAEFYSVNNIICNNYYYNKGTKEFVESDISVVQSSYGYKSDIEYCVYGNLMRVGVSDTQLTTANNVITNSDVFLDSYLSKRVYAWAEDTDIDIGGSRLFSDPYQPLARYAPIRQDGAAVMGDNGVTTYIDYSNWKTGEVKMSYKTLDGEMTPLGDLEPAAEANLIETFYETRIVPGTVDRTIGIVGASAWADEDQSYTLRLIEEPVNGEVENITLYGDTYRSGTEVTIMALPDYTCEFLGWYDKNDILVSPDAAYTLVMLHDTELKAKFTGPTEPHVFMNIECEQVEGTHGKFPITITTNWLAKAFNDLCPNGVVTDGNVTNIENALNAPDEVNGLNHVWQNYVLGQLLPGDPNGRIWLRAEQTRDPSTLNFRMQELTITRGCGFRVRYRLNTQDDGKSDYERGEYSEDNSFEDKIVGSRKSRRVIDLIFIPTNCQNSAEFVTTVNTAGVVKVDSSKKIEILSSPWAGFSPTNNPAVKATDYVKASSLTTNDILYVYDQANSNYLAWAVRADGTMRTLRTFQIEGGKVVSERGADATRTNAIPRGAGAWLERQDVTRPIYLYGQVDESSVTTPLASGWNLVGYPFDRGFTVSDLPVPTPERQGDNGDHVIIPTDGAPINLTYKNGSWGYTKNVVREIGGKTFIQPTRETNVLPEIPAGCGFWYISTGSGEIKW